MIDDEEDAREDLAELLQLVSLCGGRAKIQNGVHYLWINNQWMNFEQWQEFAKSVGAKRLCD